jgi:hypothetical protein
MRSSTTKKIFMENEQTYFKKKEGEIIWENDFRIKEE